MKEMMGTMNARQRFKETIRFGRPDKIPFDPGWPRESTLRAWHAQGLSEETGWREQLFGILGIPLEADRAQPALDVNFALLPAFEEKVIEHRGGHYLVQDWMGATVEISDTYDVTYLRSARDFVTRRWHSFPVATRQDWLDRIRWRYDPADPRRFPADFANRCDLLRERSGLLSIQINGPFWQMREWCGFEGLCILMAEQPDFILEMAAFWSDFVLQMFDRLLPWVQPDCIMIAEDMAYKIHSMISPRMTRRFLLPTWQAWVQKIHSYGDTVAAVDSDGYISELLPLFIEAGFEYTWPVEVAAGNDLPAFREQYGCQIAYGGGVDKRALAAGGEIMLAELKRLAPVIAAGGYLPGCDHGVPPDISWPDFIAYSRRLAELTGWL